MAKKRRQNIRLPNDGEAGAGALLALANARRHLRAAEILGANRLYGPGSSHIILAMEELAKAQVLTLILTGIDVPNEMRREILRNHGIRHNVTYGLLLSQVVRSVALNALTRTSRSGGQSLEKQLEKELKKAMKVQKSPSSSAGLNFEGLEWITKANDIKKQGFYVDFDGEKWVHPGTISKRTFVFGYKIVERLLKQHGPGIRKTQKTGFQVPETLKKQFEEIINKRDMLEGRDYTKALIEFILT